LDESLARIYVAYLITFLDGIHQVGPPGRAHRQLSTSARDCAVASATWRLGAALIGRIASQQQMVFRALRPDTIRVNDQGLPCIIDFECARARPSHPPLR
jgi:hypothetical protein